jgi:hypothetical protein
MQRQGDQATSTICRTPQITTRGATDKRICIVPYFPLGTATDARSHADIMQLC